MQLVINAGSSSLKWSVFASQQGDELLLSGFFDQLSVADCRLVIGDEQVHVGKQSVSSALQVLSKQLVARRVLHPDEVQSVVHRVVHGGEKYSCPVIIDDGVLSDIDSLSVLAPLHNPVNLEGIRACMELFSQAIQIAVFDTAFHQSIQKKVFLYGLPYELYTKHGIRKYGFHGISHSYIADCMQEVLGRPANIISAHLGSGSSITAIKQGKSVDTTMGFTPLDGVLMGTRSGKLDPDIPLFLLRQGHSVDEVDQLLSKKSGLLGISGHADLREVYAAACEGDEHSELALEMLCYDIAFYINALRTAVQVPDAIVFTAGIGERAWYVRERVCQYLGVSLDDEANKNNERVISSPGSEITVCVLQTNEQLQMHRVAYQALQE